MVDQTQIKDKPRTTTAVIYASYDYMGTHSVRGFEYASGDGRHAFQKFVSWTTNEKIPFTVSHTNPTTIAPTNEQTKDLLSDWAKRHTL